MKKALKIFGYFILGFFALLLCAAAYIQLAPMPTYKVAPPQLNIVHDSAHIAEGRRIVLTECIECHRGPDGKPSGALWVDDPQLGKLYSANLTQHPEFGLKRYSDAELAYTLRTGIKRDGHFAGPFMLFPRLSDEDLASVIAFLRSDAPEVQPSDRPKPPAEVKFLGKLWYKLLVEPLPYPEKPIVAPSPSDKVAYGRYLATGKWSCYLCHSANFESNDLLQPEKSPGFFAGGNPIKDLEGNHAPSANITPDRATGIGAWTEAQFSEALRFGKRPDGTPINGAMPAFAMLTDAEVSAIWAYLQTVPAVNHKVVPITNAGGHE